MNLSPKEIEILNSFENLASFKARIKRR